jgi:hypothetical protein
MEFKTVDRGKLQGGYKICSELIDFISIYIHIKVVYVASNKPKFSAPYHHPSNPTMWHIIPLLPDVQL